MIACKAKQNKIQEKGQSIYGLNADYKLGSMNKRTGHIPGWSTDITVMDAYIRNISNTFYKHLQQVLAQDTINTAYNKMTKKFGPELALVEGVIPNKIISNVTYSGFIVKY